MTATNAFAQVQPASTGGVGLLQMVMSAIARHPSDLLQQQQVAINAGGVQVAKGQFDPLLTLSIERDRTNQSLLASQANPIADAATTNLTTYGVGLQKQFATGLTISPNLGMTRTDLNLTPPAYGRGSISFTVVQPLLRGRGRDAVTATLRAARASLASSELTYRFTASSVAESSAAAYWSYVAASKVVSLTQDAVGRSRKLLSDVQQLVDGGQLPAANLRQVQAELASRRVQEVAAERQLVAARYQLGIAAGLSFPEMAVLPPPSDDFPTPPAPPRALSDEAMLQDAMTHRADLLAARALIRAAQATVVGAKNATKPQLNLTGSFGFAGLSEGSGLGRYFTPLFDQVAGANVTVALNYRWPFGNDIAFGQLAQQQAVADQDSIQEQDDERTIAAQVAVAASNVRLAIEQIDAATQESSFYASAVDDEQQKMELGLSTVLDLVVTEDRRTQAELDVIDARASYALAVAELRYDTGTILTDATTPQVSSTTLLTLP